MPYENILYRKEGPIAFVTIERPAVMNAIDPPTSEAMARVRRLRGRRLAAGGVSDRCR